MNRKYFFDLVRQTVFGGKLSIEQVQGCEAIIDEYEIRPIYDLRKLAYILATAFHETAHTMQPVEEIGKGASYAYGKKLKRGGGPNKRIPYDKPDKIYYGRGHVQLTWFENYEYMGKLLKIDLLNRPELMLTTTVSIKVMFEGMLKAESNFGDFTGKSLEDYFNQKITDWYNARRIINGTDAAAKIAKIAETFYGALKLAINGK